MAERRYDPCLYKLWQRTQSRREFCTRCGHKAPVLASQSSDSIDAQKELTTAQSMMAAVNLPDLQAVYAHLDKAAQCQDQALLQQLKVLADKYADIANLSKNLSRATAQTVSMNPYLKLPLSVLLARESALWPLVP